MAHFAHINQFNTVDQIIVISNEDCGGGIFPESEPIGQAYIASLGLEGLWLQTSYSGSFRGTYAGTGYYYDALLDIFKVIPDESEI
jgi:hypothetical protein